MSLENMSFDERDSLAELSKKLADNPKTRKAFLRLTKEVNPELTIPEIEIEESTNSALMQMQKENESLRNKFREKEALEDLEKRRNNLMKKGLAKSDDDVAAIEKVMLEEGITNHEAAARHWAWMQQAAAPTPSQFHSNVAKNQGWDLSRFSKNPIGTARDVAHEALAELRKNRPIGF
jgi:hypothetical protein